MSMATIGVAAAGAAISYMGNKQQAKAASKASGQYAEDYNRANANLGMPKWSAQQEPYVWGEGYDFPIPQLSQEALDYGQRMVSGGNASGPMSIDELLAGLANPSASPDMLALLGYGAPQSGGQPGLTPPRETSGTRPGYGPPQGPGGPIGAAGGLASSGYGPPQGPPHRLPGGGSLWDPASMQPPPLQQQMPPQGMQEETPWEQEARAMRLREQQARWRQQDRQWARNQSGEMN